MTYTQTNNLIKAIDEIETWASDIERECAKESFDHDRAIRLEGLLQEAKERVFNLVNK